MKVIEMNIEVVNKEIALFKLASGIAGVIHSVPNNTTVIVGGNYLLGKFHCPACAIDRITDLHINIKEADDAFGMDYQQYKKSISVGLFSTVH